jgi:Voltage gated chloride channel
MVRRVAVGVEGRRGRLGMAVLLLLGGLAVGVLAQVADLLGADSQDVLFSGQSSVPSVVAATSTRVVLVVLVAKALAYAVSLGCGFRGGPIFPAIFLGVALASLTVVWFGVSPTLAVAVGVDAGMVAQTGLLFSAVLFAALLVGRPAPTPSPRRCSPPWPPSSSSALSCWVEMLELDAGVLGGEAPVDPATGPVARRLPGCDLPFQGRLVAQAAVQALLGQHGQLDLGHVQPAAMLGGVVQL